MTEDNGIPSSHRIAGEQFATQAMYEFRMSLAGQLPEIKLIAAKALLSKVRTMAEDLEQSV